ncbi:MAG: hypothetical protein EA442_00235 [Candidatus Nitrosopelagicus sp.]|jgi:hypothetical protein|nr:MAG: hypothetical protein EA442_00235 [Candidatus Nitrosopelagicus sp.]
MAKFKKKKFKSEKPDPEEKNDDLPEIEADESVENTENESESEPAVETPTESKPDPTEDPIDKSATKKLTDRLFWLRIAVSIAGGVIATFAFEDIVDMEEKRWTSIGFMIMLFIATAIIAKSWRIKIANKKKYVTTGIGSFVFMYLFMWIFSYTVVNAGTSKSMIPGI